MSGSPVQEISVSEPQAAVVALYLRDVGGIPAEPEIPRLSPAVERREIGSEYSMEVAAEEWSRWWEALMANESSDPRGSRSLEKIMPDPSDFPTIAAIASSLGIEADSLSYSQARKREAAALRGDRAILSTVQKVLTDARPTPFRRSREISLLVTQLPVKGEFVWKRSAHHIVVSLATCSNPKAYDRALRDGLGWSR